MSMISELIQEFCPDGVEYIKLKTLIDKQIIINVKAPVKLKKENYKLSGKYPIIDQGQNYIVGFSDDDSSLVPKGLYVIFGDHTENFKFADFPFIQGADGIKILRTTRQFLDTRYFYYALESYYLKTGGYTRHYSFLMDTSIPIPPLKIQEEIVKILDNFTQLEAELEAELEARKKQYEYYRKKLLSFEGKDVEWKTLGEVGKVCMCKRVMKNETSLTGEIPFYKIGTFGKKADAFISKELYEEYKKRFSYPRKGEILISAAGTIGRAVIYDGYPAYFQDSNIVWINNDESQILNKFLYHYYSIVTWETDGGTISRLYNDRLLKTKVPVPSFDEQQKIISILDKFDSLVNDISIGLPAEIEARRKQYEYYRGKLLSFREKKNEQS